VASYLFVLFFYILITALVTFIPTGFVLIVYNTEHTKFYMRAYIHYLHY
jgi:hypothetical protein